MKNLPLIFCFSTMFKFLTVLYSKNFLTIPFADKVIEEKAYILLRFIIGKKKFNFH